MQPSSRTPGEEEPSSLRILLAEDVRTNQMIVQMILTPIGATVTVANDGAEALRIVSQSDPFDLILMDMQMPIMGGVASTAAIRAFETVQGRKRAPIAMLSASHADHDVAECRAAGADLHVPKPITAAALLAAVQEALRIGDRA